MVGRTFSANSRGTLTRTVSPLASELMTRTCSQRSLDADVVDWVELAEVTADCAKALSGERRRAAVELRVGLAKKLLLRADMTGLLLTGGGPGLGDRHESSGQKDSCKCVKIKVE